MEKPDVGTLPPVREGFRQAMAWLHTWAGLVLGWLLFAIFLTGTLSLFKDELNLWMHPALHATQGSADAAIADKAQAALLQHAPDATRWLMRLPDARNPAVYVLWRANPQRPFESLYLHPQTGAPIATRDTMGGDFFYRFHFELRTAPQGRWTLQGRWVVGVATLLMFIALLTGIATHRRIFKDFFTFRPGKGGQRAWLDAHNLTGVLVLPFYLMITFSGLMIFHTQYLPAAIATVYPGERQVDTAAYFADLQGEQPATRSRTPQPAQALPTVALQPLIDAALQHWGSGVRVGRLQAQRDVQGRVVVDISQHDTTRLQHRMPRLRFDGLNGTLLEEANPAGAGIQTYGVLVGLHMARFASPGLRWALLGLGLLGCLMIATGLVLWSVKRSTRRQAQQQRQGIRTEAHATHNAIPWGERLVAALNRATLAGLPLACAVYLAANRLLPLALQDRANAELLCFFSAWGLSLLWALWSMARHPGRANWSALLGTAGVAWAALPLLNALTTQAHLGTTLRAGDWLWAGMDLSFLATGVLLCALAWRLRSRQAIPSQSAGTGAAAHTLRPALASHSAHPQV